MEESDKQSIWEDIDNEGFDYTFRRRSSFPAVDDQEFHKLREAYREAADALEDYVRPADEE